MRSTTSYCTSVLVVARYDDLAATIMQRYEGLLHRIEVSIPVTNQAEQDILSDIIRDIS